LLLILLVKPIAKIFFVEHKIELNNFADAAWHTAEAVEIERLWSGVFAPPEKRATARLLWSNEFLFARFDCRQREPLIVADAPDITREADKLWERDVCEIFVAPDEKRPERYFEFEVAPTGEWLDYAILQLPDRRETDTGYDSGIETAVLIEEDFYAVAFKIGWQAFGKIPRAGDCWLGNLFRCAGANAATRYLAWQPTRTEKPNFHVPAAFGIFKFE